MKVTWGEWSADAYPVEPFVYEVVADGKKEFYQAAWDAFRSDLHMKNATAKIIKIPVTPMSDYEIETEQHVLNQTLTIRELSGNPLFAVPVDVKAEELS